MSELTHVKGLQDLQKVLDTLPAKLEQNVIRGGLRAGANVFKDEAKAQCPVGPATQQGRIRYKLYEGALRDSIRVFVKAKDGIVTASVRAGGKLKNGADVWYAHLIEYTGARAHKIIAHIGKALNIGAGIRPVVEVDHPGFRPKPFMRPAMDARTQDAVVATGNYIKTRLSTKHGIDTAGIDIEVQA